MKKKLTIIGIIAAIAAAAGAVLYITETNREYAELEKLREICDESC